MIGKILYIVKLLLQKVIDLQDFRLRNTDEYEEWYGQPHRAPDLQVIFSLLKLHHLKDMYSIYTFGHLPHYGTATLGPGIHIWKDKFFFFFLKKRQSILCFLWVLLSLPAPSCLQFSFSHMLVNSWKGTWSKLISSWAPPCGFYSLKISCITNLVDYVFLLNVNAGWFHQIVHFFHRPESSGEWWGWFSGHNICMVAHLLSSFDLGNISVVGTCDLKRFGSA